MISNADISKDAPLVEQRQALQRKMQAQRQLLALQLRPASENNGSYPRSMTMRLLTQRPTMTAKLFAGFATLLLGARIFKSITTILAVANFVRTAAASSPKSLPTPQTSEH